MSKKIKVGIVGFGKYGAGYRSTTKIKL